MSEQPLRVLVLGDSRSFHMERYVDELRRQGCEVLMASLEDGTMPHHRLRKGKPRNRLSYLLASSEIRSLITGDFAPDVINAHYAVGYGASTAIAARGVSAAVVLHVWGSDILVLPRQSFFRRMKAVIALKSADIVLGDSRYLLKAARTLHRFPHGEVIPWGIEQVYYDLFSSERLKQKPVRIISPRAHEEVYNHLFVLEALLPFLERGELHWSLPNWGSEVETFKEAAAGLLGKSVFLYSRKVRGDLMRFFAEHDLYLSASHSDSSPASLIEAMGLGLIPVCADIPGIREWLHRENGFMFEPDSEKELHEIIRRVLGFTEEYASLLERNRQQVVTKGIFETNVAQMIAIMREAAAHTKATK